MNKLIWANKRRSLLKYNFSWEVRVIWHSQSVMNLFKNGEDLKNYMIQTHFKDYKVEAQKSKVAYLGSHKYLQMGGKLKFVDNSHLFHWTCRPGSRGRNLGRRRGGNEMI